MITRPGAIQQNLYISFMLYLNAHQGHLAANDAAYYDFLDEQKVLHEDVIRSINLCSRLFVNSPFVLYRDGRHRKGTGGDFYLTRGEGDIVQNAPRQAFPSFLFQADTPKKAVTVQREEEETPAPQWTREELVNLLTCEAHVVGRMLGPGYDLLEPVHGEWIKNWLLNPHKFKIIVHQAHRDSYKSTCLRLAIAINTVLMPLRPLILIRKSEDSVQELIKGISKILDTPLFHYVVSTLYPDIEKKGGFKKTTDTASIIDTNLNTSLSGEAQLRGVGLGSPITGMHAPLIITDDICTKADRESAAERERTRNYYRELINVLSHNKNFTNSTILNIGTPWHEEDVFELIDHGLLDRTEEQKELDAIPFMQRNSAQKERIRQLDMARGKFVYNCYQTGLMSEEDIAWKRKVINDDLLFEANYLLNLLQDNKKPFPRIDNRGHYSVSFFADAYEVMAHIDAKYSGTDTCSLTIGAFDYENNTVVAYGRVFTASLEENYMDVADIMWNCGVQKLFMERNTDKGLMGSKFREIGFDVNTYHESTNKHTKISSAIKLFWREKGETGLPCVQFVKETDTEYLSQIHNYQKGVKTDDAPDNLASFLIRTKFGQMSVRIT